MNDQATHPVFHDPRASDELPPPGMPGGDLNQRGGRIDIENPACKFDEALEETFPASDAPCHTPPGAYTGPPPRK